MVEVGGVGGVETEGGIVAEGVVNVGPTTVDGVTATSWLVDVVKGNTDEELTAGNVTGVIEGILEKLAPTLKFV